MEQTAKHSLFSRIIHMRLSRKLPLAIAGFALMCGSAVSVVALYNMTNSNYKAASENMAQKLEAKDTSLEELFNSIVGDLHALADSPYIIQATIDFTSSFQSMGENPTAQLQADYISNNPNPTGKKHLLDAGAEGNSYDAAHAKYHPYLREFLLENGYYDIFLVDTQGNVVYTAYKELDFATNLLNGQWKETELAKAYTRVMAQKDAEQVSFVDFAPYAPSNNAPASFMGRPIEDENGTRIGALIYQMPIDRINKIFNDEEGLGATGRILLVGEDGLLRNDVRFAKESTILKVKIDTPEVKAALAQKEGVNLFATSNENKAVVSAYEDFSFDNADYALIFEIDYNEIMAPVFEARREFILIAVCVVSFVSLLGYLLARSITRPLGRINAVMSQIANADNVEVPYTTRADEIGDMARTVEIVRANVVEATRLRLALHNASANMMIADQDLNIVYLNPSVITFLTEAEGAIQKDLPQFKVSELIGKNIDIFHKNPAHQRGMLTKLSETFKTSIAIGGRNFNLIANPIFGKAGERLGYMVEWIDGMAEGIVGAVERTQAMIEFELDGTIVKANDNFLKTTGYTLDEIKGKHHRIFCEKEYVESADYKKFWEALVRGEFQQGDSKRLRKDGSEVWINASYNPIRDIKGKPVKVVKVATDITATKLTILENERGIAESVEVLSALSKGVLTHSMQGDYKGTFREIKSSLNATIDRLLDMVKQIIDSAKSVNSAASEISSGSIDLSQRTEQQASSLEETAASMEQITGTVKQNSANASTANELSTKANRVASDGGKVVEEAITAMTSIEKSSKKISDIIGVIDEIAFQTNLLALNAAVEAARAGDAGKGFAVVASEVRSLAGRSASASKEIKALISESANQVQTGAELVNQAGDTLRNIVSSVQQVAGIVADIAAASQEQATGIDEVNTAVTQMDEVTQQNAALVEENTAAAQSMVEQARALEKLMSFFTIDTEASHASHEASQNISTQPSERPKPAATKPAAKAANGKLPAALKKPAIKAAATSTSDGYNDGWEEF